MDIKSKIFLIAGPTASGKSSFAIKLAKKINGEIFNVGFKNQTVNELAENVKSIIGEDIKIINTISNDNRSYHVSSQKIKDVIGFETKLKISDAVVDLKNAFDKKLLQNTFNNENYFNIKKMQSIKLI